MFSFFVLRFLFCVKPALVYGYGYWGPHLGGCFSVRFALLSLSSTSKKGREHGHMFVKKGN
jgi:hypothetical protein